MALLFQGFYLDSIRRLLCEDLLGQELITFSETPISIPMLPPSPLPSQQCKDCNKMSTETGEDVNNDKGASTLQGIDDGDLKDGMVPRAFVA